MLKRLLLCLLWLGVPAWADSADLPAGGTIEKNLVKGKTTIVEFYANW